MKNLITSGLLLFTLLSSVVGFTSCSSNDVEPLTLSEQEKATLQFMREEEKLAHDVYQYFHEKYGLNMFGNIASSEQTHMDAVLTIMVKYGVADLASNQKGVFINITLQKLYNDLIAKGETSLANALTVGATIEDLDIKDLNDGISATANIDIDNLYEKLKCGSKNHMRAFTSQLSIEGVSYLPQFISKEQFSEIINGAHQQCGRM